jgi:hypothetical protein
MVEVSEVAFPRRRGAYRAAPRVARRGARSADPDRATRDWIRSGPLTLSEARRAGNRARIGPFSDLRCECSRPNCTETLPSVAGTHRRADQPVVTPADFDGGGAARVADLFFVIESPGDAMPRSRREKR